MRHNRRQKLCRVAFMELSLCRWKGTKNYAMRQSFCRLICRIALTWQVKFVFSVNFLVCCLFSSVLAIVGTLSEKLCDNFFVFQ